jgi:hypothetical protein
VRYQAALRPDICCSPDSKPPSQFAILFGLTTWRQNQPDPGKTVTKPHQVGSNVDRGRNGGIREEAFSAMALILIGPRIW